MRSQAPRPLVISEALHERVAPGRTDRPEGPPGPRLLRAAEIETTGFVGPARVRENTQLASERGQRRLRDRIRRPAGCVEPPRRSDLLNVGADPDGDRALHADRSRALGLVSGQRTLRPVPGALWDLEVIVDADAGDADDAVDVLDVAFDIAGDPVRMIRDFSSCQRP